jgi:hypothetical protein
MKTETLQTRSGANLARRSFLKCAGAGAASVGLLAVAGCHKDRIYPSKGIDIGSGDYGILNFAYALEQLEAAFYLQVAETPYHGISSYESVLLTDIRDHELCHREFFKAALGSEAIPALKVDFSSIDFSNRRSVLLAAKAFEDLGVQAYDGAGYLIQSPDYLTIAGKIVSVEARHAALIRDLLVAGDFAGPDQIDANGLNGSLSIAQVLPTANTFLKTKVSAKNYGYNVY